MYHFYLDPKILTPLAEVRGNRTHLPAVQQGHAALKAGRDTSPHPPPVTFQDNSLRKASTRSVFSQVKSGSRRPKCPYTAVFR